MLKIQENTGRISEADFVNFLLKNGKLTPKKKGSLVKKIETKWPSKGRGVSFPSFKVTPFLEKKNTGYLRKSFEVVYLILI